MTSTWEFPPTTQASDGVLECDYESPCCPALYKKIELAKGESDWLIIEIFLNTGFWSGSLFADLVSPQQQAMTRVTRQRGSSKDRRKNSHSGMFPLHLAIARGAPLTIVGRLVELYPHAVHVKDGNGLLPVQLALQPGAAVSKAVAECAVRAGGKRDSVHHSKQDDARSTTMDKKPVRRNSGIRKSGKFGVKSLLQSKKLSPQYEPLGTESSASGSEESIGTGTDTSLASPEPYKKDRKTRSALWPFRRKPKTNVYRSASSVSVASNSTITTAASAPPTVFTGSTSLISASEEASATSTKSSNVLTILAERDAPASALVCSPIGPLCRASCGATERAEADKPLLLAKSMKSTDPWPLTRSRKSAKECPSATSGSEEGAIRTRSTVVQPVDSLSFDNSQEAGSSSIDSESTKDHHSLRSVMDSLLNPAGVVCCSPIDQMSRATCCASTEDIAEDSMVSFPSMNSSSASSLSNPLP